MFYVQHQDDETIFGGSTVIDAIESVGRDNVYIVLVTDGSGSNVFNYERYKDITHQQKVGLRDNEFRAAIDKLGIKLENVVFLNQPESKIDNELLKDTVLYFENSFNNVTHITHSYKYETHVQHIATGNKVNNLYINGIIKDCRFLAREDKISGISRSNLIESVADDEEERKKVLNACREYELDNKDMATTNNLIAFLSSRI
ncbi:PIG-L family deacetylase [uncultured Clostridium sp.]|uniref:PIG-L family deacetylase n=1 Tax=uncultured Clostridium sp. TaxID=59620 RepID=UPI003216D7F2